jgi:hypothetical protein
MGFFQLLNDALFQLLNDALKDSTIRLLVELIDRATNWRRFGRAFVTPMDGTDLLLRLREVMGTRPDMPLILKVLVKAEENRSRIHWHATEDIALRVQKDVMKSPFKDARLERGFDGNLETLKEFLMDYLYQYITYPKRALLLRALNKGETSGWFFDQFKGYEDQFKGVWREFEAAAAKGDYNKAKELGEQLLQYTWGDIENAPTMELRRLTV